MKTTIIAAAAACALLSVPAIAQAETSFYTTLGYANVQADDGVDVELGAGQVRVGAKFNQFFAVEGEAAHGVNDDTVGGVEVKLNNQFGVFAVASYPFAERFEVFGRVGYSTAEFEANFAGVKETESNDDVAYGVGATAFFSERNGVRLDYTNYGDADAWSVAYVRKW
ncbi:MAG: porin family protein [Pseudomonadota bacterium]